MVSPEPSGEICYEFESHEQTAHRSSGGAESVLRVIPHADLKNLDPIWTTAYISRNHAYLVYDTLFAMDEDFKPQPQMVDTYETSKDGKTWTFKLRDGLKFHDGADVTSKDVIASLERWGARDGMGQQLMGAMDEMVAVDDSTFEMRLKEPFGLVLESIGKISSNVPFIMPARIAATDPFEQIEEHIGSGPFKFEADERSLRITSRAMKLLRRRPAARSPRSIK